MEPWVTEGEKGVTRVNVRVDGEEHYLHRCSFVLKRISEALFCFEG